MEDRQTPRDVSASGKEAPEGYRWVYGELEPIPQPVTDDNLPDWETADFWELAAMLDEKHPPGTWFKPISPDGTPIDAEHTGYMTAAGAIDALLKWCRGFRQQGGYRDGRGYFIPYSDLLFECDIVPV